MSTRVYDSQKFALCSRIILFSSVELAAVICHGLQFTVNCLIQYTGQGSITSIGMYFNRQGSIENVEYWCCT